MTHLNSSGDRPVGGLPHDTVGFERFPVASNGPIPANSTSLPEPTGVGFLDLFPEPIHLSTSSAPLSSPSPWISFSSFWGSTRTHVPSDGLTPARECGGIFFDVLT